MTSNRSMGQNLVLDNMHKTGMIVRKKAEIMERRTTCAFIIFKIWSVFNLNNNSDFWNTKIGTAFTSCKPGPNLATLSNIAMVVVGKMVFKNDRNKPVGRGTSTPLGAMTRTP